MPSLAAILHTLNDALRIGRALESLRPCDEILIVDHGSRDSTLHVAREYGARIVEAHGSPAQALKAARSDWALCLEPHEALTEALEATLYEWKLKKLSHAGPYSVLIREERPEGWIALPSPQARLIPRIWTRWNGNLPAAESSSAPLEGEVLRFCAP